MLATPGQECSTQENCPMVKIASARIKRFASAPNTGFPTGAAQPHEYAFLAPIQEKNARCALEALNWGGFSNHAEAIR